ncbi:PREDICTED: omega-hydroxypalmitate O-feruloyl transferase-like [Prunus mume]|uniref:Omega-hydroxypalmitate O-feruloyl transferase-like n=1 Tax=Prunus mume TaxID=102107 RepID=A0ABM1LSK3_PRUMU|nr:PREDICTED: omega-hydroxypalmitate O-feruloyl transferase-like [Prunus mume]
MSFSEAYHSLFHTLGPLLAEYDFLAGRRVPSLEDSNHFEIECNGAGVVVAAARTDTKLDEFGELLVPKKEFRQFVAFLPQEAEEMDHKDKPLVSFQFTQLGCGSLVFASRFNHCAVDGVAVREFEANLAALTRGGNLVIRPNADRTMFKARNPPNISFPHFEYSKATDRTGIFTVRGLSGTNMKLSTTLNPTRLIYLSQDRIASLKKAALKDGKLKSCTIDVRKQVVPPAPPGFAGNALVPAFAHATVKEIKEEDDSSLVRKVQEGVERLDDEYVRSGIDWLEVNKGVPCEEDSFSLVSWWKLGIEHGEFSWGQVKCTTSVLLKPGLVMLLPVPEGKGGLSICLELPDDQMELFCRLMLGE